MAENYTHLEITRTEPINERRKKPGFGSNRIPPNPKDFAKRLAASIKSAVDESAGSLGGFDSRYLLRIETDSSFLPDELPKISPEVEVVAQEDKGIVIAFATAAALAEFERRLTSIMAGERPQYQNVLFALDSFASLRPEDRLGRSLREFSFEGVERIFVDVELFPLERSAERQASVDSFRRFLESNNIDLVDLLSEAALTLLRVRVERAQLDLILRYRDVRKVDLPPRYSIQSNYVAVDVQNLPLIDAPPDDAPRIAVLDTGVESGHPLLSRAMGDAVVFSSEDPELNAQDDHGHGTAVAGIALYRDVEKCIEAGAFIPEFWILSGRVLDERATYYAPTWDGSSKTTLIEKDIERAVTDFKERYGCKIFNLSFGDLNRVYAGGRIEGLAVKLDALAREKEVLFIVSTGNRVDYPPGSYPQNLFGGDGRLLDPATAVNVVTVGGIARYDQSTAGKRYGPSILTDVPIARYREPAPVTRVGPTVRDILKPDFVDYSSNWAIKGDGSIVTRGLGVITTALTGAAFTGVLVESGGTSISAPSVTHMAAQVLKRLPDAPATLIRAILACHAHVPEETSALNLGLRERDIVGYGQIDDFAVAASTDLDVTMVANDSIQDDKVHFYELPLPPEFFSSGKRERHITVALSYFPPTRSTRVDYIASRISFHLVKGDIGDALQAFNAAVARDEVESMSEYTNGRTINHQVRSRGSLQMSRWNFKVARGENPKFVVVVTRNDPAWGEILSRNFESYSLAVRISDRQNSQATLYEKIANLLRIRPRARA